MKNLTPRKLLTELADRWAMYTYCVSNRVKTATGYRLPGEPGEVILHLSEEERAMLKELKSDDLKDLRVDVSPHAKYGAPWVPGNSR